MTDTVSLDVGAISGLLDDFKRLEPILQSRLARGAAGAVMTELRDRAIELAPEQAGPEGQQGGPPPGNLKRAIYCMRIPEESDMTTETWKVDARKGKGRWKHKRNQGRDTNTEGAYYAGFVEFGHWSRTPAATLKFGPGGTRNERRKAYQASGRAKWVAAHPYMRPAIDSMKNDATRIMQDYVDRNLPEALRTTKYMKVLRGA